jgi:hypothetical protein
MESDSKKRYHVEVGFRNGQVITGSFSKFEAAVDVYGKLLSIDGDNDKNMPTILFADMADIVYITCEEVGPDTLC